MNPSTFIEFDSHKRLEIRRKGGMIQLLAKYYDYVCLIDMTDKQAELLVAALTKSLAEEPI